MIVAWLIKNLNNPFTFAPSMFLLGHVGITVGIIYLLASKLSKAEKTDTPRKSVLGDIDFRIVIIAAMLPDIIDKVVGMMLLKEEVSNGRIFTHTFLLVGIISIFISSFIRLNQGNFKRAIYYVTPIWIHLLLDKMWEDPHTLFWPLFGTGFPRIDIEFSDYFTLLISTPYIMVGEIAGGIILITLIIHFRLFIKTRFLGFLSNGRLESKLE
jgi:Ca2+/Na+ antiporter